MTGPTAPSAGHGAVLVEVGRRAWAVAGIVLVAVLLFLALTQVSVVVIALLIALFPAALLAPGVSWLRSRGAPSGLAAAAVVLALLGGLAATVALIVPVVVAEAPALSAAATRGLERVEDALRDASLPVEIEGIGQLLERGFDAVGGGELAGRGFAAATTLVQFATGLAVMLRSSSTCATAGGSGARSPTWSRRGTSPPPRRSASGCGGRSVPTSAASSWSPCSTPC
jgi:hypothetical protein